MAIYYNSGYWCDVIMTSSQTRWFKTHIRQRSMVMKLGGWVGNSISMLNPKLPHDDVIDWCDMNFSIIIFHKDIAQHVFSFYALLLWQLNSDQAFTWHIFKPYSETPSVTSRWRNSYGIKKPRETALCLSTNTCLVVNCDYSIF